MCGLALGRTLRIRRRRAESVDDTTDSLRAVACIRFVRPWLVDVTSAASSGGPGAVAECEVVGDRGGIQSNVCYGYRIANRPCKEDEEIAVSQ